MSKRPFCPAQADLEARKFRRMSPFSPTPSASSSAAVAPAPADGLNHAELDEPIFERLTVKSLQNEKDWEAAIGAEELAELIEGLLKRIVKGLTSSSGGPHLDYPEMAKDPEIRALVEDGLREGSLKVLRLTLQDKVKTLAKSTGMNAHYDSAEQKGATIRSWNREFKGAAVDVLLKTLSSFMDRGRDPYARYATFVNSSGTGKSRIVDELGKRVVVVPMCLRQGGTYGFPPADMNLRDWLLRRVLGDPLTDGFIYALLTVTKAHLEQIVGDDPSLVTMSPETRLKQLASAFRTRMVEWQTFDQVNDYRRLFYEQVIDEAGKFATASRLVSESGHSPHREVLNVAAQELLEVVWPGSAGSPPKSFTGPLAVFSFDESHTFTTTQCHELTQREWSVFSEIRRALHSVKNHPVFALFSSTRGKFQDFSPEPSLDRSSRVVMQPYSVLPAITEIVFDELAQPAGAGSFTLEHVSGDEFMCHLGRPLFGSRYDAGSSDVKEGLLHFAAAKLTGTASLTSELGDHGVLACLAVRFALEFRSRNPYEQDVERRQVESHMRICLAATPGFETMVTVAASEPLLAEAAAVRLKGRDWARELVHHLDVSGVQRGQRGELVAMLLLMQARDKLAYRDLAPTRVFSVIEFLHALLPDSVHHQLGQLLPAVSRENESKAFSETFKDARMAFNHFIKVTDFKMLNVEYLWRLVVRGAAVLCADGQLGVDIVIPFLFRDTTIHATNVSAILVQVKNASAFTHKVKRTLFDGMDPFSAGIFSRNASPLPVIRMVFSLASPKPALIAVKPPKRRSARKRQPRQTAYDIWCAGVLPETFAVIKPEQVEPYNSVLARSLSVYEGFELKDDPSVGTEVEALRVGLRRRMHPGVAASPAHFDAFISEPTGTNEIHREDRDDDYEEEEEEEEEESDLELPSTVEG
ncbi:hypothetical protein OE88DRAFT_1733256 [Heliocybe sulcata]|uniref:Uncharacterized protein n=1 Tax=Heliocybe sulcata TaxID=5364 RepID=A0A5C3NA35_9AGAM|nr:hypothetical protein OE88DRAFT_1733256 [Heliocybe sulcata]